MTSKLFWQLFELVPRELGRWLADCCDEASSDMVLMENPSNLIKSLKGPMLLNLCEHLICFSGSYDRWYKIWNLNSPLMPVTVLKRGNEKNFSIALLSCKEKFMFCNNPRPQNSSEVLSYFFLLTWYSAQSFIAIHEWSDPIRFSCPRLLLRCASLDFDWF